MTLPPTPPLSHSASSGSLHSSSNSESPKSGPRLCLVTFKPAPISTETTLHHRTRRTPQVTVNGSEENKPLTLYLLSKRLGKARIANVAAELASSVLSASREGSKPNFSLSVNQLATILEGTSMLLFPSSRFLTFLIRSNFYQWMALSRPCPCAFTRDIQ